MEEYKPIIEYQFRSVLFGTGYILQIRVDSGEWKDADRITCDIAEMTLNRREWPT